MDSQLIIVSPLHTCESAEKRAFRPWTYPGRERHGRLCHGRWLEYQGNALQCAQLCEPCKALRRKISVGYNHSCVGNNTGMSVDEILPTSNTIIHHTRAGVGWLRYSLECCGCVYVRETGNLQRLMGGSTAISYHYVDNSRFSKAQQLHWSGVYKSNA